MNHQIVQDTGMTSRERVIRTLKFQKTDRAPRELWTPPFHWEFRRQEFEQMLAEFPEDFEYAAGKYGKSERAQGNCLQVGEYTDEWGVLWSTAEAGIIGEVKQPILEDESALARYRLPWELLEKADFSGVETQCASSTKFIKAGTHVRPFERLQFLRGTENTMIDLYEGTPSVMNLLDQIHEFSVRELEMWAKTPTDAAIFIDDWGSQTAPLISPTLWRQIFKPMYAEYCRILHKAGKFVFFHSDGQIEAIYPDLIEIGIDAINSQLFCMNIEGLAEKHKGKITFWGEIDRQHLLPFGTPEQVKEAVRRVRRALDDGHGGVIAQCSWGCTDPYENIAAVFEVWNESWPAPEGGLAQDHERTR